jgi:hypothetical protein
MDEKTFLIGDAVGFGWDTMKNNVGFFVLAVLIMWIAAAIPGGLQSPFYMTRGAAAVVGVLFGLLSIVVGVFVNLAQIRISLRFCSGETADFEDLYNQYPKFVDMLIGTILYGLIVLAGFILLIIPGIYWAIRYHFYGYLILDQDMKPVDAIKRSGELTRGVWWHLLGFWIVMWALAMLGFILCCVGALFTTPIIMVSIAYVYRTLLARTPATNVQGPQLPPQPQMQPPMQQPPAQAPLQPPVPPPTQPPAGQ